MSLSVPINFHLTPDDILRLIGKQVCLIRQDDDRLYHIERMKIYLSKGRGNGTGGYLWWRVHPLYREIFNLDDMRARIHAQGYRAMPIPEFVPNRRAERVIALDTMSFYISRHLADGRRKWRRDKKGYYGKPNAMENRRGGAGAGQGRHPNPEIYKSPSILPMTAFGDSALKDSCY
tara:strand:+ start:1871 stop:2398 length:528 start_codon:yes stop_codon:yes gene_type:complete